MILTQIEKDGISLVFNETGEAYYPGYRALARVCSLNNGDLLDITDRSAICHHDKIKRIIDRELKEQAVMTKNWKIPPSSKNTDVIIYDTPFLAEVKTAGGIQSVMLISRSLGTVAIRHLNGNLYEYMAELGHLAFLHQLAGYKVTSSMIEPPLPKQAAVAPKTLINKARESILDDVDMRFDLFIQNVKDSGLDPKTPRLQAIARRILGVD